MNLEASGLEVVLADLMEAGDDSAGADLLPLQVDLHPRGGVDDLQVGAEGGLLRHQGPVAPVRVADPNVLRVREVQLRLTGV